MLTLRSSLIALTGAAVLAAATPSHARWYRYGSWHPPIESGIRHCAGTLCPFEFAYVGTSYFSGLPVYTPIYPYAAPIYQGRRHRRNIRPY
jgi:hypothetical protein